jgi:alpha-D-ribose 1-methylphosphonate 5-triphosphate synthase subunit PhnL
MYLRVISRIRIRRLLRRMRARASKRDSQRVSVARRAMVDTEQKILREMRGPLEPYPNRRAGISTAREIKAATVALLSTVTMVAALRVARSTKRAVP